MHKYNLYFDEYEILYLSAATHPHLRPRTLITTRPPSSKKSQKESLHDFDVFNQNEQTFV
jgi:hypothetical protein